MIVPYTCFLSLRRPCPKPASRPPPAANPPPPTPVSPTAKTVFESLSTKCWPRPKSSARPMPGPRSARAAACRSRPAWARLKMSSATATNRWASRSMSVSGAAMPAPRTFRLRLCRTPCARPSTLPASPPKTRWQACPTPKICRSTKPPGPNSICSFPGRSTRRPPPSWRCAARRPRLRPTSASPTARVRVCRHSSRISGRATAAVFAAAMPARVTRFQSHRLPVAAPACSAIPGTARCVMRANWPRPKPSAVMPPSAPCRA